MSVRNVTDIFAAAVRRSEQPEPGKAKICLKTPIISDADATKIADATGQTLDENERKAITKLMSQAAFSDAGTAALKSALAKPKMTNQQRSTFIKEKRKELRETAADVCGSAFAMIFLPGSCAVTVVGAAAMSDAKVAELID